VGVLGVLGVDVASGGPRSCLDIVLVVVYPVQDCPGGGCPGAPTGCCSWVRFTMADTMDMGMVKTRWPTKGILYAVLRCPEAFCVAAAAAVGVAGHQL